MKNNSGIPGGFRDVNRIQLQRLELALNGGDNRNDNMTSKAKQLALHEDWEEKIPEEVQEKADEFVSAMAKKSSATDKCALTREELISQMREHGVEKVRVNCRGIAKIIEINAVDKVKLRKVDKTDANGEAKLE